MAGLWVLPRQPTPLLSSLPTLQEGGNPAMEVPSKWGSGGEGYYPIYFLSFRLI